MRCSAQTADGASKEVSEIKVCPVQVFLCSAPIPRIAPPQKLTDNCQIGRIMVRESSRTGAQRSSPCSPARGLSHRTPPESGPIPADRNPHGAAIVPLDVQARGTACQNALRQRAPANVRQKKGNAGNEKSPAKLPRRFSMPNTGPSAHSRIGFYSRWSLPYHRTAFRENGLPRARLPPVWGKR